jgi:hypothetical protein
VVPLNDCAPWPANRKPPYAKASVQRMTRIMASTSR